MYKILSGLFFTVVTSLCFFSWADDSSLYFYTPKSMESVLDVNIVYGPRITKDTDDYFYSVEDKMLKFGYHFGVTDTLSVGASIGSGERAYKVEDKIIDDKYTLKNTGLTDLIIDGKWRDDWWLAGLELGLAWEDSKESGYDYSTKTSHDGNLSTGGHRIKPMFGVIFNVESFNIGGETSFDYHFESNSKYYDGHKTKTTDDHIFNLSHFVEWNYGAGFISAKITREERLPSKYKSISSSGYVNKYENGLLISKIINLSFSYNFTPTFLLLLSHEQQDAPKAGGSFSSFVLFTDTVGVRSVF